jgi:uncharacterized protein (UPF0276 family)
MTAVRRGDEGQRTSGIGLRSVHVAEVIASPPAVGWLEVHAENYMAGGPAVRALERIRASYPVSLHAVGLSLGSADGIDREHLARLRRLIDRLDPMLVSDHLAWSRFGGAYLNDLLPLPCTRDALDVVARNVDQVQERLGRALLVENPSSYLRFHASTMPEAEFLAELTRRTGCRLLCDINNLYVTATNLGLDATAYLAALPGDAIDEFHLAGHCANDADGATILIDDHGSPVGDAVWALYATALERFGPRPTLIEWDTDIPPLSVLVEEARHADRLTATLRAGQSHAVAR